MKTHKQAILILTIGIFVAPQIAFASWWNPLSWRVWNVLKTTPHTQQTPQTQAVATTSTASTTELSETQQLRKEVEELKKQQSTNKISPTPHVQSIIQKQTTPEPLNYPIARPWGDMERDWFATADKNGWASLTINHGALGEKRYYRKENGVWVRKTSEAEAAQPITSLQIQPPAPPVATYPVQKEDSALKIARCQAETKVSVEGMRQILYKQAEDGFGKNIADAEKGIAKSKLAQLDSGKLTPENVGTLSPAQQMQISSSSKASVQPLVDYYESMKQKNLQLLAESKKDTDKIVEQFYNTMYLKCLNK